MAKRYARLRRIDGEVPVTEADHGSFLFLLESALLLALRERGLLDAMAYRHAAQALKQQRQERTRSGKEEKTQ